MKNHRIEGSSYNRKIRFNINDWLLHALHYGGRKVGPRGTSGAGLPNFWINRNNKVCVSCSRRCAGASLPRALHLTRCPGFSVVSEAIYSPRRAIEGQRASSKIPSRVKDREVLGGTEEKNVSQIRGH